MQERKDELISLLNSAIAQLAPIHYNDINVILNAKDELALGDLETSNSKLGITIRNDQIVMTVLSLIATITDVLCDERLAFQFNEELILIGFQWYNRS